jgi:hypothetical protein
MREGKLIGGDSDVIFLPHGKGTIVNHWPG